MNKFTIFWTLLIICSSYTFGQTPADTITTKKIFGGYQFYQGEERLTISQLKKIVKPNEQAYKEIKAAQTTNVFASIFGGAGGFMVGYPIGTALGGGKNPNWTLAGIGAGLILVSLPISFKFNKQIKQAVNTYNTGLRSTSFLDKTELKFEFKGNSIGLAMRF